jgi:hypothetical protein
MNRLTGLFRSLRTPVARVQTSVQRSASHANPSGITMRQGGHSDTAGTRNAGLLALMVTFVGLIGYHSFNQLQSSDVFNTEKDQIGDVVAELKREEFIEEEKRLAELRHKKSAGTR